MSESPNRARFPHGDLDDIGVAASDGRSSTVFDPPAGGADNTVLDPSAMAASKSSASRAANEPRRVLAPTRRREHHVADGIPPLRNRIDSVLGRAGFGIAYAAPT